MGMTRNMREHKYKAWHKQEQKMYEVTAIYFGVQHGMGPNDIVNYVHLCNKSRTYIDGREVELLEYTGLKDKNKKDGYKDDLVKLFDRSLFRIAWSNTYARFQMELAKGEEMITVYNMDMLQYGEISGNIYENPELLEQKG